MENCTLCNRPTTNHHSMCPENIINSDAYQYQQSQTDSIIVRDNFRLNGDMANEFNDSQHDDDEYAVTF